MTKSPPTVCVFCGASAEQIPATRSMPRPWAVRLQGSNAALHGSGQVGIMGLIATCLAGGGTVTGIIPEDLQSAKWPRTSH